MIIKSSDCQAHFTAVFDIAMSLLSLNNLFGTSISVLGCFCLDYPTQHEQSEYLPVRGHYVGTYHMLTLSISLSPSMVYEWLLVVRQTFPQYCTHVHPCQRTLCRYHCMPTNSITTSPQYDIMNSYQQLGKRSLVVYPCASPGQILRACQSASYIYLYLDSCYQDPGQLPGSSCIQVAGVVCRQHL